MKRDICLIISSLLFFLLPFSCFSQEESPQEAPPSVSTFNSLQKSFLIPGWGQAAEKRHVEAALFFSAEVLCLYKAFSYNHRGNEYYGLYQKAGNREDAAKYRRLTKDYDTKRNRFLLISAGVWAVNLIDIYVIVRNKEKKDKKIKLELKSSEQKLAFGLSFSF